MFESVQTLLAEHEELQEQLADPELHSNPARSKKVNRRYAELTRIVAAYHEWRTAHRRPRGGHRDGREDESFAAEVPGLTERLDAAQEKPAATAHPARPQRRP